MHPSLGETVIYRSRTGNYSVPAIVTATQASLYRPGVEGGFVRDLSSENHVHLTVFTPGAQVVYPEYDIPFDDGGGPGTWRHL